MNITCFTKIGKCCTYLENSEIEIEGITILGIPWIFRDKSSDFFQNLNKEERKNSVDILLTHMPPFGYGDIMTGTVHAGSIDLTHFVMKNQPKYHIFGHAHEGYGVYTNGKTIFVNGSTCSRSLNPENPPVVFDYEIKSKKT